MTEMTHLKKVVITAMMIASCVVLPMAFHAIPGAGPMLLPMHIPVLLAGLICGPVFGFIAGLIGPFLSSILTGMPPAGFMPVMMIELSVYGAVTGIVMKLVHTGRSSLDLYASLLVAMLFGRIVAGIVQALIFFEGTYTMAIWITSLFITSLPGIVIQIVFVPGLVMALEKERIIPLRYPIQATTPAPAPATT
ncbi:MAG: ECF transporter S component [Defluviitaleaceae bacterium]|nr:ECF transporter S component [Defluviitaleaceae bacterium]